MIGRVQTGGGKGKTMRFNVTTPVARLKTLVMDLVEGPWLVATLRTIQDSESIVSCSCHAPPTTRSLLLGFVVVSSHTEAHIQCSPKSALARTCANPNLLLQMFLVSLSLSPTEILFPCVHTPAVFASFRPQFRDSALNPIVVRVSVDFGAERRAGGYGPTLAVNAAHSQFG